MTDDGMLSIGDLARRTGLPVRTIRFYSELTQAHVEKLDLQIRTLRLRRAVLRAVAKTETTAQEAVLMHELVTMSEPERQRLIDAFLEEAFGGLDANPDLVALLENMRPELPDDPEPEQVGAWVELAELVQEPHFRASVRRMAEFQAAERADGDATGLHHELTVLVVDQVQSAIAADVDPASPAATRVVGDLIAAYARTFHQSDTEAYRADVLRRLEVAADPRTQRYLELLAQINGWPPQPDFAPVFDWFTSALRLHRSPTTS